MPQTGKSSALKRSARSIVLAMVSSFSRHLSTDVQGHVYTSSTLVVHLSSELEEFSKTTAAKEKDITSVKIHDKTTNSQNFSIRLQTALPISLGHTS